MPRPIASEGPGTVESIWGENTRAEIALRAVAFPVYKLNDITHRTGVMHILWKLSWRDSHKI
jgi:hypothetical protein